MRENSHVRFGGAGTGKTSRKTARRLVADYFVGLRPRNVYRNSLPSFRKLLS